MQREEEKKGTGPKTTKNHQQRLENIVKQTTVETRVRHIHIFDIALTYIDSLEMYLEEKTSS